MELQNIKDRIVNFYDLETEEEKTKVIEAIKNISNTTDKIRFVKSIRETFEQKQLSGIGIVYEALGHYPKKWGEFFFEEFQRAFTKAENSNEPFLVLDSLDEISMTDESEIKEGKQIIEFLSGKLNHQNEVIKYKSIWYLGDWIDENNVSEYGDIINKIKLKLNDSNWRIRIVSKRMLSDLNRLPSDYKMKLSDKLKVKFLNEFKM